jgi:hypothetical protein
MLGHEARAVMLRNIRAGGPQFAALRQDLIEAARDHRLMKTGTAQQLAPGITPKHAYAILGFDKRTDLVHVWNPHGKNFTPNGPDGPKNGYATKRGEFEIPLRDLLQLFQDIHFETEKPVRR